VTHGHGFSIGASGEAASAELTELAETGNNGPLAVLAMGSDAVGSVVAFPAPPGGVVLPGGSVSATVTASASLGWLFPVGPFQQWSPLVLALGISRWRRCLCKPTTASF
jgi:hypothetical protein